MDRIRKHLTFANVVSVIALFVALGGTAMAAVIITDNSQVARDTISGHAPPSGDHSNIISGSVNAIDLATSAVTSRNLGSGAVATAKLASSAVTGTKVADNSLTGADIADRSGVDTCPAPLTAKLGPICAGSDGAARTWINALSYCSGLGLRLPSVSEAITMAQNYTVPGVAAGDHFWTDDEFVDSNDNGAYHANLMTQNQGLEDRRLDDPNVKAVCVTDPSA